MVHPSLTPPDDINEEYVPSQGVLRKLPDPRSGFEPGTQLSVEWPGPVLQAATIADIRVLRGLLKSGFPPTNYMVGPLNNPWVSALTNAVLAGPGFEEHVRLLIENGARPHGFPDNAYRSASARFLRGRRPDETTMPGFFQRSLPEALRDVLPRALVAHPTTAALTEAELQDRRQRRARFWAEADFPFTDFPSNCPPSSLTAAISVGNTALYEYLVEHGADETAWLEGGGGGGSGGGTVTSLADGEGDLPVSYFVVESPLQAAVRVQDRDTVLFLLDRGHKPDAFPIVLPTRCRNVLMNVLDEDHCWSEALDLLLPHADVNALTPVFGCHLLHFAVAMLDMVVVKRVLEAMGGVAVGAGGVPVPKTALGHTLLHIASLPLDDTVANLHADAIRWSVHEFRTTSATWAPTTFLPSTEDDAFTMHDKTRSRALRLRRGFRDRCRGRLRTTRCKPTAFRDVRPEEQSAQAAMVLFLLDSSAVPMARLGDCDVHGNTALHYLVSVRNPDEQLLGALRQRVEAGAAAGEWTRLWASSRNLLGFSPKDLSQAGEVARAASP